MNHDLKIHPQFYVRVADGSKTFEVRDNDRGFQMGDTVVLREFDLESINATTRSARGYTDSPPLAFTVGYVYILSSSQVIFSLLPISESQRQVIDITPKAAQKPPAKAKNRRKG